MNYNFSIVIPYHALTQTIDFVKRQLNYYHFNQTPMTVILAVSGDVIVKAELEQFIKKLNDSRFIFFSTDETDIRNKESFLKKIFDALKMVATPYVIINGADDVIIPESICKGTEILANNLDIAAVKGYTTYFNCESGEFLFFKDLEILDNCPINRIKVAIEDRDSIYYIIRRTKDLVREYNNIVGLSKKSTIVRSSLYHIEHLKALSVAALGKVYVFKFPWRLGNTHINNHTSHTESSFLRVELGVLDKANYEWFKSVNENMHGLSYGYYKFLWVCSQIRCISVSLKQIAYHFIYKNCSLINSASIFICFVLHKIYVLSKKCFFNESSFLQDGEKFFKTEQYNLLKKYYFSEKDLNLIGSKQININE